MEDEKAVLRAVTDEIMYAILELSGQEYVDQYAADRRRPREAGGAGPGGKFPRAAELSRESPLRPIAAGDRPAGPSVSRS